MGKPFVGLLLLMCDLKYQLAWMVVSPQYKWNKYECYNVSDTPYTFYHSNYLVILQKLLHNKFIISLINNLIRTYLVVKIREMDGINYHISNYGNTSLDYFFASFF